MAVNNALNNNLSSITGLFGLKNPQYKRYAARNFSSGNIDIYTVPTGKKVLLSSFYQINISSNVQLQIKISGNYYRLVGTSVNSSKQNTRFCLFLPGETISYNYSGGVTNPVVYASYIEFDDDTPIVRPILTSFSAGNNTLYTCPSNVKATPINFESSFGFLTGTGSSVRLSNFNSLLNYFNSSGNTRTLTFYCVKNGDSPNNANATWSGTQLNNQTTSLPRFSFPTLESGDSCVINTDSSDSGQIAWMTLWERPL